MISLGREMKFNGRDFYSFYNRKSKSKLYNIIYLQKKVLHSQMQRIKYKDRRKK
jgi:hypothetical protein